MTVPTPRSDDAAGRGRGGVLDFVAESLRRLEDSVARLSADVNRQLGDLPVLYVPRREVERRFDDLVQDVGAEQAARQGDVDRLTARMDEAERHRVAGRRWAIGALLTSLGLLVALASLLLPHLP
jgi:hypothetical protein